MTWKNIETAPKDEVILLNVGLPWAVVGAWNEYDEGWTYCQLQLNVCDGLNDWYFENEREKAPTHWMPMPELPKIGAS